MLGASLHLDAAADAGSADDGEKGGQHAHPGSFQPIDVGQVDVWGAIRLFCKATKCHVDAQTFPNPLIKESS